MAKKAVSKQKQQTHHRQPQQAYGWYLVLVGIYALLNALGSYLITVPRLGEIYAVTFQPMPTAWLLLNIVLLIIFVTKKFDKTALVLPIYYIADYFISIVLGIVLVYHYNITDLAGQTWITIITGITSIFEIGFALYLWYRKI
ncbi:hypothetical protein HYS47_01235 [Candidatus Woesearchaeota archaeon]|nr:hypothetical protein [Candidatus Woesearchaeota archaeon]